MLFSSPTASGCPATRRDGGSSGCTVELCKYNMHHATRYAHSAGGCPIVRDDGSRGAPLSRANAICTAQHALPTLPADTPPLDEMTGSQGAPSRCADTNAPCITSHRFSASGYPAPRWDEYSRGLLPSCRSTPRTIQTFSPAFKRVPFDGIMAHGLYRRVAYIRRMLRRQFRPLFK